MEDLPPNCWLAWQSGLILCTQEYEKTLKFFIADQFLSVTEIQTAQGQRMALQRAPLEGKSFFCTPL